jgi:hypothetical protein
LSRIYAVVRALALVVALGLSVSLGSAARTGLAEEAPLQIVSTISVGATAGSLALDAAGRRLFVARSAPDSIGIVDLATLQIVADWPMDDRVGSLAYDPKQRRLFATIGEPDDPQMLAAFDGRPARDLQQSRRDSGWIGLRSILASDGCSFQDRLITPALACRIYSKWTPETSRCWRIALSA